MRHARQLPVSVLIVFLLFFLAANAWGSGKVALLAYGLRPVAAVKSGRYIKTEWRAKLQNRAPEPVNFSITIILVDSNNKEIEQIKKSRLNLDALETKTFSDTILIKAPIAEKIASSRLTIDEAGGKATK